MAFVTKVWKDRLVEYAGRRKLTNVATGEELLVDVSRSEGTVNQAGDAFSATNMNNLEQRIKNEFDNVNESLANGNISFSVESDGAYATYKVGADTVTKKLGSLSNKKVIEAYDYGLFNLSSIDGYQNFVLWDNLFVVPGKVQFYNPNWVGDIQQTYSYDSNTGILTINTGHGWLRFWQVTVYY